jgi:hypothetical protein
VALEFHLETHRNVVPSEVLALREDPIQRHRLGQETHPEGRRRDREHQPERDRVERLRAKPPRCEVDAAAEGKDPAAAVCEHSLHQPSG